MRNFFTLTVLVASAGLASAQSTLSSINNIFQASCTSGCHSAGSPSGNLVLNTGGDLNALYANLVNVTPTNPAAASKGYKLVDPGYPANSFLLRKCAYDAWDNAYDLPSAEGSSMPQGQANLAKQDIELIRQWILFGAPQSGSVVNPQTLANYYNGAGITRIPRPEAPAEGEGYQLHLGPFFLNPGEEKEFYKKEKLLNEEELKVVRFESTFNDESHHYLLFQFDAGEDASINEGMRPVTVQNAFQNPYMVGWVDSDITNLPAGTAYKIRQNSVLDLNYHIINYATNGDSVLAAEAYVNFYIDNNPQLVEMHSELLINGQLLILNNGQEQTFSQTVNCGGINPSKFCQLPGDSIYVWYLSSHTHKYGTDYDIYKRLPGGGQGEQLYEGFYNTAYEFNQGFYDWSHPANLYYDELMPLAKNDGLIQRAKFRINNPNEPLPAIIFGLTTDDEMMLAFIQYTAQPIPEQPNGVEEIGVQNLLTVYPNPSEGAATIAYTLPLTATVQLEVFNSVGQLAATLFSGTQSAGASTFMFDLKQGNNASGLYFVRLMVDGKMHTQRLVIR